MAPQQPPLPPPPTPTKSFPKKAKHLLSTTALPLFFCLVLLLLSFFFFSKNALEQPTLSFYQNYLIWSPTNNTLHPSPPPPSPSTRSPPPPPPPTSAAKIDPAAGNAGGGLDRKPVKKRERVDLIAKDGRSDDECDLYGGEWVKDEEYPVYEPNTCPYLDEAFNCQGNGRPDTGYMKWRWKPKGCDLRFNATDFLERLRGRRLMLIGDSMNRNQFESILCLLRAGLSDKNSMYETHGYKISKGRGYFVFKFKEHDFTVEFVRSHFLVREGTRINHQGNSNPTLSIDKIDKSAGRWKRADILVFNTGHWWTHGKTARGKNYYKEGNHIYPQFDAIEAYKRAIKTWGKWIDANIDPRKKLVFYRGYSSAHFRGGDWDSGGTCNGEKEPILRGDYINTYPPKMKIVDEVIRKMKVPVVLLNVTRLTNFRKDGHPSIYGKNATEGRKVSRRRQDCSHWCLPGVPDAWNELIYMNLVLQQRRASNQNGGTGIYVFSSDELGSDSPRQIRWTIFHPLEAESVVLSYNFERSVKVPHLSRSSVQGQKVQAECRQERTKPTRLSYLHHISFSRASMARVTGITIMLLDATGRRQIFSASLIELASDSPI